MRADSAEPAAPVDLSGRAVVGLAEVMQDAAQLVRVDRKYLVPRDVAAAFVSDLPDTFRVLSVAGRRSTSYSSIYFDTPGLDACRDHVQQRRRRWKVRSRLYVEDRFCRVEVKVREGRDVTAKTYLVSEPGVHGRLTDRESDFVAQTLAGHGLDLSVDALRPSMEVTYRRATLADTGASVRVTLDWGVHCRRDGGEVRIDRDWVLVETKGGSRPSEADRTLLALGARPRPFSKYVSAASLLCAQIPDNDVRRLRGRVLHTTADLSAELPDALTALPDDLEELSA